MAIKKSFADDLPNTALGFMSPETIAKVDGAAEAGSISVKEKDGAPEGMKLNPAYIEKYIEKRTARLQFVLQPSLVKRIKAEAARREVSVNELIHTLLDEIIPK